MLNLLDSIDLQGITLYRDDQDPRKFYPLPGEPWIPLDETGTPRFLFVKYIANQELGTPTTPGGGYMQFTASVALRPEKKEAILRELEARLIDEKQRGIKPFDKAITTTTPLLGTPSWVSGEVAIHTWEVGETGLVRATGGSTEPDLAGALNASFSVTLSPDGAEVFWTAVREHKLPIILAYKLRYKARVSGASLRIDVKREKVLEQIWSVAKPYLFDRDRARYSPLPFAGPYSALAHMNLLAIHGAVLHAMAPKPAVREIVKSQVDVEISIGEGGGEAGDGDLRTRLVELATTLLTESILPAFFGDSEALEGVTDADQAEELLELRERLEESMEPFHLEIDQDTVVERGANPNGALSLLIPDEATRGSLMRELPEGTFFSVLDVTAETAGVNFVDDGIVAIKVKITYDEHDELNGLQRTFSDDGILRSHDQIWHQTRPFIGLARSANSTPKRTYTLRTEVHYREGAPSVSERRSSERRVLITPRALSAIRAELLLTAPVADVESARVDLRCTAPSGAVFENRVELTQAAPRQSWFQFLGELDQSAEATAFEYRATWRVPELGELQADWVRSTDNLVELAGPFSRTLSWTFRPQGSLEGVTAIAIDLCYEYGARAYVRQDSFTLGRITDSHIWKVRTFADGADTLVWGGRIQFADGTFQVLPPTTAAPGTVWVGRAQEVHGNTRKLKITVNPMLLDFDADLKLVVVELSYADPANGIDEGTVLQFFKDDADTHEKMQSWELEIRDPTRSRFSYTVRYIAQDPTRSSRVDVADTDDTLVLLDRSGAVPT